MRVEIYPGFITQQECDVLNAWVDEAAATGKLDLGLTSATSGKWGDPARYTSRKSGDRYEYPDLVHTISNRIRCFMGIDQYPLIFDHGKNGVVVSRTSAGPGIYEHCDPDMPAPGTFATLRCNILTRAPESGGVLDVGGVKFPQIGAGDLHCYLASKHRHSVGPVFGDTSRVLWMFGAYVPEAFWEKQ